jgi:hypothetical protein
MSNAFPQACLAGAGTFKVFSSRLKIGLVYEQRCIG